MAETFEKPKYPKNGDTKTDKDGTKYVFRYGTWFKQKLKPEKKSLYS